MKYFIRYGEIGVKSPKIRRKFENKLISNIQCELEGTFENDQGRITLITDEKDEKVYYDVGGSSNDDCLYRRSLW